MRYKNVIQYCVVIGVCTIYWKDRREDPFLIQYIIANLICQTQVSIIDSSSITSKGFVMPGHNYTGPGNPLEQQLRYDPNTGQRLETYQQPTGKTDAVSMQHDVDYTVCSNKPKSDQVKCKNDADRKMAKALDAIPWKDRQWEHAIPRNAIAAKSKLGMGAKPKNGKSRRVK